MTTSLTGRARDLIAGYYLPSPTKHSSVQAAFECAKTEVLMNLQKDIDAVNAMSSATFFSNWLPKCLKKKSKKKYSLYLFSDQTNLIDEMEQKGWIVNKDQNQIAVTCDADEEGFIEFILARVPNFTGRDISAECDYTVTVTIR